MSVRLLVPMYGQAINTVYWGTGQAELLALGKADTRVELASDYSEFERIVTTATANTIPTAFVYRMNSATGQTLTVQPTGYPPGTVLTVIQEGAGATTIVAGTGVTINTALASLISKGQWNVAQLIKRGNPGEQLWVAVGGLGG